MIDKETKFLKDWALRYIKNKDLILKKIVEIDEFEDGFMVIKKDREQKFFIIPFLKELSALERVKTFEKQKAVVCFHTKQNFDILLKQWEEFVGIGREFTIMLVNPFSKSERVLVLNPHTHQMISDEESLEQGLKTMAETVELTTEEEIKKIINT